MSNSCLHCGNTFFGRADKKFCSDQCRATYHYQKQKDSSGVIRRINQILKRNHQILRTLNPNGKSRVHKNTLLDQGFKFSYHTNTFTTKNGHTYTFCYDQGYVVWDDDYCTLVERQDYVD
ncbi:MAG: hypothetical protein H6570_18425 [Lewinellaceae bacterium]|nr:hypothetical protein [Lewinellaceae bacterium]